MRAKTNARVFSLLLAVMLLLAGLPTTAMAATETVTDFAGLQAAVKRFSDISFPIVLPS